MTELVTRQLRISSRQSYFLFGPRGTGKSTWMKQNYKNALVIDLLKPDVLRKYIARPETLAEAVRATKHEVIIIDEVQKVPELLSIVHSLIEEKKGWQFILTGSSARKLKRTGVDLLAGRAVLYYMHPFTAAEVGDEFSLKKTLKYGLVPLIVESDDPDSVAKAYINLYLTEEINSEGLIRNIGDFARFLEVASFSHGGVLNISNIARECEVSRKIVESYLSVLKDLLLCHLVPVFSVKAKRKIISHPKFYFFDVGVYNFLRPKGFLDGASQINGPGLEGLVLQHLVAWNDYNGQENKIFYWRTKHGVEVDFIIYGPKLFYAIEVKHSDKIHNKDLKGLKAFLTDYPEATAILVYQGDIRLKKGNVLCIPVTEFLMNFNLS